MCALAHAQPAGLCDNDSTPLILKNNGPATKAGLLFLVEVRGVEPLSESTLTGTSPGADGPFYSLAMTQAVMLHGSVASFVMPGAKLTPVTCTTQVTPKPGSWSFRGGRPH